jgi:mRNA interferase MazF
MHIKRGEIWLADLDPTIGREQAGTRPILVFSSDFFNQGFSQLVYAIPLTSRAKSIRSHISILPPEGGLRVPSYIMCESMRSISTQRLIRQLGVLTFPTLESVEDTLKIILDM